MNSQNSVDRGNYKVHLETTMFEKGVSKLEISYIHAFMDVASDSNWFPGDSLG